MFFKFFAEDIFLFTTIRYFFSIILLLKLLSSCQLGEKKKFGGGDSIDADCNPSYSLMCPRLCSSSVTD